MFHLMDLEITRRLRASSEAEKRHLSLRSRIRAPPAGHLSSWSQTPAGHPLVAHETRLLSPSFRVLRRWRTGWNPPPTRTRTPAKTRPRQRRGAQPDASSGRPSRAPTTTAALLAHLARGRSSDPLACSGSSSGGGGGGGGSGGATGAAGDAAAAVAAFRRILGGMTPHQSRSQQAVRRAWTGGRAHVGARPVLSRLPLQK